MIGRRELLKRVSAGAGSVVFSPLLRSFAAQAARNYTPPKRVVFILFDNGFHELGAQPEGVPLGGDKVRELPLQPLALPKDIAPFHPLQGSFDDRPRATGRASLAGSRGRLRGSIGSLWWSRRRQVSTRGRRIDRCGDCQGHAGNLPIAGAGG